MEEHDKPKTVRWGFMSQGITNAPSTFQRLMKRVMVSINFEGSTGIFRWHHVFQHVRWAIFFGLRRVWPPLCLWLLKIVKPLNDLTGGYPPYLKGPRTPSPGGYFNPKEPFNERWTPACQRAFDIIIEKLTSAPSLVSQTQNYSTCSTLTPALPV